MKLECIISLANRKARLRFLAMERSLRATGCQLPLLVIPYDDDLFDLPGGATWWDMPEISGWIRSVGAYPAMRKCQCLTRANYQFVDSDIIFLKDPAKTLEPFTGFVTSCGHWHNPEHTTTEASRLFMSQRTTTWQRKVFNSGQFACDARLYQVEDLISTAMGQDFKETCTTDAYCDQPGLNLLVFASDVQVNNLTLSPTCMESTWAGDYPTDYQQYWTDQTTKPYLIHWAGTPMDIPRPLNETFYQFLTREEKQEWDEHVKQQTLTQARKRRSVRVVAHRVKHAVQAFIAA